MARQSAARLLTERVAQNSTRSLWLSTSGVLAALVLMVTAGPAAAHDVLVGTEPADGATISAPAEVVLNFSAEQLALGNAVAVTGPDGEAWSDGPAVVSGSSVSQPLRPDLPNGPYTVLWRSVSEDGHPISGSFTFTVEGTATASPAAPAEPAAPPSAGPAEDEPGPAHSSAVPDSKTAPTEMPKTAETRSGTSVLPIAFVAASVVAVAAISMLVRRRRHSPDEDA